MGKTGLVESEIDVGQLPEYADRCTCKQGIVPKIGRFREKIQHRNLSRQPLQFYIERTSFEYFGN